MEHNCTHWLIGSYLPCWWKKTPWRWCWRSWQNYPSPVWARLAPLHRTFPLHWAPNDTRSLICMDSTPWHHNCICALMCSARGVLTRGQREWGPRRSWVEKRKSLSSPQKKKKKSNWLMGVWVAYFCLMDEFVIDKVELTLENLPISFYCILLFLLK